MSVWCKDEIYLKQNLRGEWNIANIREQEQSSCLWIVTVTCYFAKLNRSSPEWAAWTALPLLQPEKRLIILNRKKHPVPHITSGFFLD